jgi:hypothetical protein
MRTISVTILFFLTISAASYYGFVTIMAERYGVPWGVMSETTNEVVLASPLRTAVMILVIGLLSYGATWFTFGSKRRE